MIVHDRKSAVCRALVLCGYIKCSQALQLCRYTKRKWTCGRKPHQMLANSATNKFAVLLHMVLQVSSADWLPTLTARQRIVLAVSLVM